MKTKTSRDYNRLPSETQNDSKLKGVGLTASMSSQNQNIICALQKNKQRTVYCYLIVILWYLFLIDLWLLYLLRWKRLNCILFPVKGQLYSSLDKKYFLRGGDILLGHIFRRGIFQGGSKSWPLGNRQSLLIKLHVFRIICKFLEFPPFKYLPTVWQNLACALCHSYEVVYAHQSNSKVWLRLTRKIKSP